MTVQEIKNHLKINKITYIELSKKSNIPLNTLKSIFSGATKNPRIDTIMSIEKALNLQSIIITNILNDISDEEKQLIFEYRKLETRMKARCIGYIFALQEQQRII